jgi:hypothetical protein
MRGQPRCDLLERRMFSDEVVDDESPRVVGGCDETKAVQAKEDRGQRKCDALVAVDEWVVNDTQSLSSVALPALRSRIAFVGLRGFTTRLATALNDAALTLRRGGMTMSAGSSRNA